MQQIIVKLEEVGKQYGRYTALKSVSLEVHEREFFVILGPSGSGKSTLLRLIAGIEQPTSGRITYLGRDIDASAHLRRDIVMVWQSLALFPHMDVAGNIGFGLAVRGVPKPERVRAIAASLELVGLSGMEKRYTGDLSGGEQQRVALARALVVQPRVLLLDEAFGSLDAYLREELQAKLRQLHRQTGATFIMVSHDQSEALGIADRVAIIKGGALEQVGLPEEIMTSPASKFVAQFVGHNNLLDGIVTRDKGLSLVEVRTDWGTFEGREISKSGKRLRPGDRVTYVIAASSIRIGLERQNKISGSSLGIILRASRNIAQIELTSGKLLMYEIGQRETAQRTDCESGQVSVSWSSDEAMVLGC